MVQNGFLYRTLLENMINGFAHCQLIYKDTRAIDWRYVIVNPAFQTQTGLRDIEGRRASEIMPGLHDRNPRLLEIFERVASTRRSERFEEYLQSLQAWFDITVYAVQEDAVSIVFENVTQRKQLEADLIDRTDELRRAYDQTIESWSQALDLRDTGSADHSRRLWSTMQLVLDKMHYYPAHSHRIKYGVLLHDIGKILVPDQILKKPGALTEDEWRIMRQHPEHAYKILRGISYLKDVLDIPYSHHERWDGKGYPRGIMGNVIPMEVRIFSVVDVFDAMTTDRPYRGALPREKVFTYIRHMSGTYFDPVVVKAFLEVMEPA